MFKQENPVPATRSEGLLVECVGDETVVYDTESKEAHCLNPLASVVFAHSDGRRTAADIAVIAEQQTGHPVSEAQIATTVRELEATSLLETPLVVVTDSEGLSRRQMMRKTAFAGAAATVAGSAVMTIAVPTAMAGCSKQVAGCGCSKMVPNGDIVQVNTLCLSGHCCGPSTTAKCNVGCCATTNDGAICTCQNGVCQSVPTPGAGQCCNSIPCVPAVSGSTC